jgi:GntR family transcriptional repressor for pyruvate dehydrogenase complex
MAVYSPIRSSRLYEEIVGQIEQRILEGELSPGDKLPSERELADQFGVSRTAVREAVKALREKGLVEIQPGKGTFITNDTSEVMRHSLGLMMRIGRGDSLVDLIQVRAILEPEIAAIAAQKATEKDIECLQQAVDTMDSPSKDVDIFIQADHEFHLVLATATQNSLIPVLIDPVVDLLREQRKRIFLVEGGPERGQYHHKRILKAIIDGDSDGARATMRAHLEQVRDDSETASSAQEK